MSETNGEAWVEDVIDVASFNGYGDEERKRVWCSRLNPDMGLCVTRALDDSGYLVTHTLSGYAIDVKGQPPLSLAGAQEALLAIRDMADWSLSRKELKASGIAADVQAAIWFVRASPESPSVVPVESSEEKK